VQRINANGGLFMGLSTVRCTVAGRVQGVCYRAATREQAVALGLHGWVRNLADGRVELVAQGEPEAVERLLAWLWEGPPAAAVRQVTLDEYQDAVDSGFEIRG
jgi:acylphosphatase